MDNNDLKLGYRVRDIVTGFTGIATSRHEYLNGCLRVSVTPPVDKDGKQQEPLAVDIQQLEKVDDGIHAVMDAAAAADTAGGAKPPGGDRELKAPHR